MEAQIMAVIELFAAEARKMEARLAGSGLALSVSFKQPGRYESKVTVELRADFWDGSAHQTVKAASLGALMDECYRRAGFSDRTAFEIEKVEQSLTALPSPQDKDLEF